MTEFSENEAAVLNHVQRTVPFVERPFELIGSELDISEEHVQEIISRLKKQNVIRNIAGIFNGGSLGYTLNLVAMEISENKIEKAADLINSHPGVSHNYLRNHRYNIWFTLAEESNEMFNRAVRFIAEKTGADDFLVLKNEKLLKLGVVLPIGDDDNGDSVAKESYSHAKPRDFSEEEKEAVRLFQHNIPITTRPFRTLVETNKSFLSEKRFIEIGESFKKEDIMRRYSAVLRHVNAGYTFNAMTTWKILDDTNIEKQTKHFINESAVSHLYIRTIYPGRWEYPLFAMLHARSETELNNIITGLSEKSGFNDYQVLDTVRELKKERVVYFSHKFNEWRDYYND